MKMRSTFAALLLACAVAPEAAIAQCCFGDFFAGCGACFRKPPVYAVAPVAPIVAPIPAPPPPVMVPVQQVSYVPETTYRTEYKTVPVTTYKPSCEIDPCTGCPQECMQPVTQYVQQAVNVPVTQYRAVTSTKYVQMQPGAPAAGMPAPVAYPAPGAVVAPPAAGASPFQAPITTTPQAWGAAGTDVSNQLGPGQSSINPPTINAAPGGTTFQQQRPILPPAVGQAYYPAPAAAPVQTAPSYYPVPAYTAPAPAHPAAPAAAPVLDPTTAQRPAPAPAMPPLRPIPIEPKATAPNAATAPVAPAVPPPALPAAPAPAAGPASGTAAPPAASGTSGTSGLYPRLLDPTSHTTSWQPADLGGRPATFRPAYPTAALPLRAQQ